MAAIELDGKSYEVDEEGYLLDLNTWVPGLAAIMAKDEDAVLTDAHWEVINFLRE